MNDVHSEIIRRYKPISHLPDFLFAFTFPLRKQAVASLNLKPGDSVLEVGCSTGANFKYLRQAVGTGGYVLGVDISPAMISQATRRIQKNKWGNVSVKISPAETVKFDRKFNALLLFAMHDVLTSPVALENLLSQLLPGATIVTAGPQLAGLFPGRLMNPLVNQVYKRFSVSQLDKDYPNKSLQRRIPGLEVKSFGKGLIYLASGKLPE